MNETEQRVADVTCERYVIGTIMSYRESYASVADYIDEDCFTDNNCQLIYKAIKVVAGKGREISFLTIIEELRKVNAPIADIDVIGASENVAYGDIEHYALRLRELSQRRKLWVIGQNLMKVGVDETIGLDEARAQAVESVADVYRSNVAYSTLTVAIRNLMEIVSNNHGSNGISGTPTGFNEFDRRGGLQKSDLIIVAGETSMGKSSWAISVAHNAISSGKKVVFYSMEMTKEQLAARILASKSGVQANRILYDGQLAETELARIDAAIGNICGDLMFFDDRSTSNIDTIISSIRSMKLRDDIDGAVIDYLQILNCNIKGFSREQIMGDVARRLKNLAKELDIWIMALSQLNRDSVNHVPNLNRLRDSGQIAEAADVVMFIYRPSYYRLAYPYPYEDTNLYPTAGTAMIDVAKGRNIGTFKFFVKFDGETTNFSELESQPNPEASEDWYVDGDSPF